MTTAIIVHGGAGAWELRGDRIIGAVAACGNAAAAGQKVLLAGGSALEAVEAATIVLENDPAVNAGTGSCLTAAGHVEMDALIMDGATLRSGAVAGIRRFRNPISIARTVMTECRHNLLISKGAEQFAVEHGFGRCRDKSLHGPRDNPVLVSDTVGAVAVDAQGNVATATSTGGMEGKMAGRVGDVPLIGCGGFADNRLSAVSATGNGEALMTAVISKQIADLVGAGHSPMEACQMAIKALGEQSKDGIGGVISVDKHGQIGYAFNSKAMPYAYASGAEDIFLGK